MIFLDGCSGDVIGVLVVEGAGAGVECVCVEWVGVSVAYELGLGVPVKRAVVEPTVH